MQAIKYKNKKAFSLIEVLVSMTIISLSLMALINFVIQISVLSVDYTNSEKTYTSTTNIFTIIQNDLSAAKKIDECGENIKSSCTFEFNNLSFKWEAIANSTNPGKFTLRKTVQNPDDSVEILFESDPSILISSSDIFIKSKILKNNSSTYNTLLKIQISSSINISDAATSTEIKKQTQLLLKNYDETL